MLRVMTTGDDDVISLDMQNLLNFIAAQGQTKIIDHEIKVNRISVKLYIYKLFLISMNVNLTFK